VAARASGSQTLVWASWNGATDVASWNVLGGARPDRLAVVAGAVRKRGFETRIKVSPERYVAVEALDSSGKVLERSRTVRVG
jgi:hypothetical protein